MDITPDLSGLGWTDFHHSQLAADETGLIPLRISAVHRGRLEGIAVTGPMALPLTGGQVAGDYAIGDWVLTDGTRIARRLDRQSLLERRAAGSGQDRQLIAANVDTLFIVTSCNADFNVARLERYLALAAEAGSAAVIVLTRADAGVDVAGHVARAQVLQQGVPVVALDARAPAAATTLAPWCGPGRTVALVGSSGVGKTTLTNTLTGTAAATGPIRDSDARGRHTTTHRSLHALPDGGWLIDTPGMRSLGMADTSAGIDAVFAEITALAGQCRFRDCTHATEPGCALQQAVAEGRLDPGRLARWAKLKHEDRVATETPAERRDRLRRPDIPVRTGAKVRGRPAGPRR